MTQRTRRRFLAVAGALGLGATAGCLSGDDSDPDDSTDPDSNDDPDESNDQSNPDDSDGFSDVDGTVLGDITIDNLHDEAHTVDVQVELDGSMASWVSKDIEGRTGTVGIDRTWNETDGDFRVRVRLDGTEFVEVTPDDWNEPDCLSLVVVIDESGTLRIAADTTRGFCAA